MFLGKEKTALTNPSLRAVYALLSSLNTNRLDKLTDKTNIKQFSEKDRPKKLSKLFKRSQNTNTVTAIERDGNKI